MTNIDAKILELLRCPVTGSKLTPAGSAVLDWVNRQVDAGTLLDRAGKPIDSPVKSALVNADLSLAMPISGGVISLTADRSIDLQGCPIE